MVEIISQTSGYRTWRIMDTKAKTADGEILYDLFLDTRMIHRQTASEIANYLANNAELDQDCVSYQGCTWPTVRDYLVEDEEEGEKLGLVVPGKDMEEQLEEQLVTTSEEAGNPKAPILIVL